MSDPSSPSPESEGPLADRLRRRFGADVDPEVSLGDQDESARSSAGSTGGISSGVLQRLGERAPTATRYRLDGEIARGGMGAILEVWDQDLRRRLAMKVALGGAEEGSASTPDGLDPRVLARFLEEAQVTGQLDHPGIVPVHELGLDEKGTVFFTMRLVRGRDLEHVFRLVDEGADDWSRTRALGVLLKACEAMAYAHSRGVIHRDLKPANVMVGRFGEVYVMDWGLARVLGQEDLHDVRIAKERSDSVSLVSTDLREDASGESRDELYTMDGDVIGTPAYMAPEQGRGELAALDARTDVYSMGAMLYRLLGGTPPYVPRGERLGGRMVLMRLLEEGPEPLEQLAPDVPAELVAVCEKAMAREPADRYADMMALAEDLRAFLEGRVVRAYEAGALAEARKWVRRNRALAASLAAGVLALAAGLIVSLFLKGRADASALLAEERRVEAEGAAQLAEERRVLADESAETARRQAQIADAVNDFLNDDLLAAVAPEHQGIDVTVREVLGVAAERLEGQFAGEPLIEAELRITIGQSFVRLGEYERASPHLERAWELRRVEVGDDAEPTLQAAIHVASTWQSAGRAVEALALYDELIEQCRRTLGPEDRGTLTVMNDMALCYTALGRLPEARELYEAALAVGLRVLGPEDPDSLSTRNNLAILLQEQGEYARAEEVLSEVLAIRRRVHGETHPETLDSINNLALVYVDQGRYEEAEALHRDALALAQEMLGPDHPDTARSKGSLAVLLLQRARFGEAEELLEAALENLRRTLGNEHPETLQAINNVGACYEMQGRYEQSLPLRLEGLETQQRVLGKEHPMTLTAMNNLAVLYRGLGRYDEAEALYRETVALYEGLLGPEHPSTLLTLENLGGVLYATGDYKGSRELVLRVLEGRSRALGPDHPDVAKTTYNLGMITRSTGDAAGAEALFAEALDINLRSVGREHPSTAECLAQLGQARLDAGDRDVAAEYYREALAVRRALGADGEEVSFLLHQLGVALFQAQDWDAAAEALAESLALRRRVAGDDDAGTLTTLSVLAVTLRRAGRYAESEPLAVEYHERRLALGAGDAEMARARKILFDLYEAWGRPEDAAHWE